MNKNPFKNKNEGVKQKLKKLIMNSNINKMSLLTQIDLQYDQYVNAWNKEPNLLFMNNDQLEVLKIECEFKKQPKSHAEIFHFRAIPIKIIKREIKKPLFVPYDIESFDLSLFIDNIEFMAQNYFEKLLKEQNEIVLESNTTHSVSEGLKIYSIKLDGNQMSIQQIEEVKVFMNKPGLPFIEIELDSLRPHTKF